MNYSHYNTDIIKIMNSISRSIKKKKYKLECSPHQDMIHQIIQNKYHSNRPCYIYFKYHPTCNNIILFNLGMLIYLMTLTMDYNQQNFFIQYIYIRHRSCKGCLCFSNKKIVNKYYYLVYFKNFNKSIFFPCILIQSISKY